MARESVRNDASSCVATSRRRREGMPVPFSLRGLFTAGAASPCRPVFQLLKHPTYLQVALSSSGEKRRTNFAGIRGSSIPAVMAFSNSTHPLVNLLDSLLRVGLMARHRASKFNVHLVGIFEAFGGEL
ncbi:hypothetical protein KM043_009567 [Ampulex compressa]|nr:hypothetical protein KM043_009567 [Ampulex compressa]